MATNSSARLKELFFAVPLFAGAVLFFLAPELSSPAGLSLLPRVDPAGVLQVSAWNSFSTTEWRRGHFPLWNPHTGLGQPHLANLQTAVWFPLSLLRVLSDSPRGPDLILLLRLLLAASFVFWLARNLGLRFAGALAAGFVYSLANYSLGFLQLVDLNSQMLLPLLMFTARKMLPRPAFSHLAGAGLLCALVILGGHPEAGFNTFLVGGLFFLFLARRSRARGSVFLPAGAALLLGILLALAALLPFANYLLRCWSLHAPGFGFFHLEARGILNLFWPGIHRLFADQPAALPLSVLERGTLGLLLSPYRDTAVPGVPPGLGVLPMTLALFSLSRLRRLPSAGAFFAGLLAFCLGLTFGLPGFRLLALLPIFNLASNFKFYFSEIHLSLAILAGFGLDQILAWTNTRFAASAPASRFRHTTAAAVLALILLNLYYHLPETRPYLNLGAVNLGQAPYLQYLRQEQATSGPFRLTGLEGFFPPNLALGFSLDDLRSSDALFYRPYLQLLNRLNGWDADQALNYFYPSYYTQPSPERLNHPLASLLGLRFAVGPRPLRSGELTEQILYRGRGLAGEARPRKLVDYASDPPQTVLFQHAPGRLDYTWPYSETPAQLSFSPWLDPKAEASDGVNFYLWTESPSGCKLCFARFLAPRDLPAVRFALRLEPKTPEPLTLRLATDPGPRNRRNSDWSGFAALTAETPGTKDSWPTLTLSDQTGRAVFLARNPHAFPRAFSVSRVISVTPELEPDLLSALSPEQLRALATAPEEATVNGLPGDHGRINLRTYEPDRVELEVRRASPGLLLLADAYYPGWRAWVDEKEVRIVRADYAFRGVKLDPGRHLVQFRFEPLDFRLGLWAGLATGLLLLLLGIARRLGLGRGHPGRRTVDGAEHA